MNTPAIVPTHKLSANAALCEAGFNHVSANSPAIEAMTDFSRIPVVTIEPRATIDEANARMISRGVRLLIVIGNDGQAAGLITARDILGEKPVQLQQVRSVHRDEITVGDLMVAAGEIDTLNLADVMKSRVRDIVATLKKLGRQHILVEDVDQASNQPRLRGLYSATQIGRQLGVPMAQGFDLPQTFAEIEVVLG
ncbi:MAG: CBS domain-containing protein [Azonexus sp.]|jgi:CBS domain-containing protein|nr:CBS domain-containing protein [Azonexus sp.]